jgi:hypothetical protein
VSGEKRSKQSRGGTIFKVSRRELWWVIAFCVFAGLRVLIFSAPFPFFNNVDERRHFDLVMKICVRPCPSRSGTDLAGKASIPFALRVAGIPRRAGEF